MKCIDKQQSINVHIDELVKGGYICHTFIDELNILTGRKYTHSVFIPGSHIVLNIEHDFEKWIGEDVDMIPQKFVDFKTIGYGANKLIEKSLVGSRKLVLQNIGNKNLYEMYNDLQMKMKLAESGKNVNIEATIYDGTVTGIINSSKKTGAFIEIEGKYITGLMPTDSMDIFNYKPGDHVKIKIKEFEVQEGKDAFIVNKKGNIIKCNTRPVFELA
jgi:ribosomal protein S1